MRIRPRRCLVLGALLLFRALLYAAGVDRRISEPSASTAARSRATRDWRPASDPCSISRSGRGSRTSASAAVTPTRCTRPGDRVHRQGQGPRALRFRLQGERRHAGGPALRRPVRAPCQGAARQSLRPPHPRPHPRRSRAPHRRRDPPHPPQGLRGRSHQCRPRRRQLELRCAAALARGAFTRLDPGDRSSRPEGPNRLNQAPLSHCIKALEEYWCPGAESNHRHRDFQSRALPTELPGRRQRSAGL